MTIPITMLYLLDSHGILLSAMILFCAPVFFAPFFFKLSYEIKPYWTAFFLLSMGGVMAYFSKSVSVFFFQVAIVFAQILTLNSHKIKNSLSSLALYSERVVLAVVLILILLMSLPLKSIIMMGLLADRAYTYFMKMIKKERTTDWFLFSIRLYITLMLAMVFRNIL